MEDFFKMPELIVIRGNIANLGRQASGESLGDEEAYETGAFATQRAFASRRHFFSRLRLGQFTQSELEDKMLALGLGKGIEDAHFRRAAPNLVIPLRHKQDYWLLGPSLIYFEFEPVQDSSGNKKYQATRVELAEDSDTYMNSMSQAFLRRNNPRDEAFHKEAA